MKKHIDSFNKQKCLTSPAPKGAKLKYSQGKATESLCGSVDTKLRKKNDYVLFNPPRDPKLRNKIAASKSSLPILSEKSSDTTLSSKLLEDLPIKSRKRINTTSQFDNYCLFDPKTDFFNEREHVLGTIPETHAVDSSNVSFVNFPDSNNVNTTTTESYEFFDEMYNDDNGCEMLAEMSNIKEINDSKTNISLFIRMPVKQNKAIQYSGRDVSEESMFMETQSDIQKASDTMNIHELITVIKKIVVNGLMCEILC